MSNANLINNIDCENLSLSEIDLQVKNLIFNKYKTILLKNVPAKENLFRGLSGNIKLEIIGDTALNFACGVNGIKLVVNGNVGDFSANDAINAKFTVYGTCGSQFGNNSKKSEFYILEGCSKNSFHNVSDSSKVVIGGLPGNNFACGNQGATFVILNIKGGNIFVDDTWFRQFTHGCIYLRGIKNKIKITTEKYFLSDTDENDEDIYLPLISEYARLFKFSLSELKSKPFFRLEALNKR